MNIDKSQILQLMQTLGQGHKTAAADGALPDQVDTENPQHADLLSQFGLDPSMLTDKLGGLGGGLGGALGKLL